MIACLRDEDEVVQHYAAKTIENIAAHNPEMTAHLASQETAFLLYGICETGKSSNARITAASALSRLSRAVPALACALVEKVATASLLAVFKDKKDKIVQVGSRCQSVA